MMAKPRSLGTIIFLTFAILCFLHSGKITYDSDSIIIDIFLDSFLVCNILFTVIVRGN